METYITKRHGGLYDTDNNLIAQDEVGGFEKHAQLLIDSKHRQLANQQKHTRKELFQIISEGFEDFRIKEGTPMNDVEGIIAKEFLSIADRLGILMHTNGSGMFLMSSKDDRSPLTRGELIGLFQGFIDSLTLGGYYSEMDLKGYDIMTRVIVLMHTS